MLNKLCLYIFMQFDEQKDQVAVEQILRVVFLDPECPSPVSKTDTSLICSLPEFERKI